MVTYTCPCGFTLITEDVPTARDLAHDPGDSCCNCGGRRCMSCVFREHHDACLDDCPFCVTDVTRLHAVTA